MPWCDYSLHCLRKESCENHVFCFATKQKGTPFLLLLLFLILRIFTIRDKVKISQKTFKSPVALSSQALLQPVDACCIAALCQAALRTWFIITGLRAVPALCCLSTESSAQSSTQVLCKGSSLGDPVWV